MGRCACAEARLYAHVCMPMSLCAISYPDALCRLALCVDMSVCLHFPPRFMSLLSSTTLPAASRVCSLKVERVAGVKTPQQARGIPLAR